MVQAKKLTALLFLWCLSIARLQASFGWTNVGTCWIQIPGNSGAGPAITNAITICAWTMRQLDRGTTRAELIARGQTQPSPSQQLYEIHILTNHYRFIYADATGGAGQLWQVTGTAPNTNVPAHIAMTYTYGVATSMVFYIDGVSVAGSWIAGTGSTAVTNNNNALQFGADAFGTPFMGVYSEVAIWESALTAREIAILATTRIKGMPLRISPSTLVGYWPLDGYATGVQPSNHYQRDLGPRRLHGSWEGGTGMTGWPEMFLSYPPNE